MQPDYGLWQIAKLRNSEMMRATQEQELLRQSNQPNWLAQQIRRLLRLLGHGPLRVARLPRSECRHQAHH